MTSYYVWEQDNSSRAFSWRHYFLSGMDTATALISLFNWQPFYYCQKWKHFLPCCCSLGFLLSLDYSFQEFKPARSQEKKAFSFVLIYYLEGHLSMPECSHVYPTLRKILSCRQLRSFSLFFIPKKKNSGEWSNGYTPWMKIIRSEI